MQFGVESVAHEAHQHPQQDRNQLAVGNQRQDELTTALTQLRDAGYAVEAFASQSGTWVLLVTPPEPVAAPWDTPEERSGKPQAIKFDVPW
jgi:hypothetical protein